MRITGPKNKIARREGMDLGLKTVGTKSHASLLRKLNILPGEHGTRGRRKQSERGKQLREKQKLRFLFGITETQLKNYFNQAKKIKGNTSLILSKLLERRLDNIVYRLGLAPTRASARQLVSHRHIKIDDKIVNIPSYQVSISHKITLANEKTLKMPIVEASLSNKDIVLPKWLQRKNNTGTLVSDPSSDEIEKQVNLRLVIEFYSR